MDLFAGVGQHGQSNANSNAFNFDPQRSLQRRIKHETEVQAPYPQEFVSEIVKAGTAQTKQSQAPRHLQEMAEAALGVQKLKEEKAAATQLLAGAQAKISRLEAERREMASYFEQQEQLVKEQEEITQAMLSERANLDNEMECLVSQRSRIASDRAQLIIEISHADGVKADLEVQRMDLDKQKAELAEQLAGIRLAKAGQLNSTDIESDSLQDEEDQLLLRHREEALESATSALEAQQRKIDVAQSIAEDLMQSLLEKTEALESEREAIESEKDALIGEREGIATLVEQLKVKREELEGEQDRVGIRWAELDREESRLRRERRQLDEQLAQLADEWGQIKAERARLEVLEGRLADREAAVRRLEEPSAEPFTPKRPTTGAPLYGRQSVMLRGDSPRDLEMWHTPATDEQLRLDYAAAGSQEAASEIDSLEGPMFIADSAASFDGFGLCKERAAMLKEERMRLWAASGNPEELERATRQLQEKEARLALREMQLEARQAVQHEQDRRFEAEEMVREWALSLRENEVAAKEQQLQSAEEAQCKSVEEAWELQNTVKQLRDQLVMAMEQCASSEKALRQATRKRRSWTKPADDSVLTSLKARGIELDDLYKESKLNTA